MDIFFISPVRKSNPAIAKWCKKYVAKMEKAGHQIHWPIRDTDQKDPVGIRICDTNLGKIFERPRIDVYYLPDSTGIHFDLGAVYMLKFLGYEKEVVFVKGSKEDFKAKYVSKETFRSVLQAGRISIRYDKQDMALHFMLGAAYVLIRILGHEKKVVLANRDDFRDEFAFENNEFIVKGGKSYLNVLNYLDKTTGGEK